MPAAGMICPLVEKSAQDKICVGLVNIGEDSQALKEQIKVSKIIDQTSFPGKTSWNLPTPPPQNQVPKSLPGK
jgi:hypothetical protein